MTPTYTEEYIILRKRKVDGGQWVQSDFCAPGDDGSFILDSHGRVCGLLYGEMAGLCLQTGDRFSYGDIELTASAGLATSMKDIIKSIELRTTPTDENGNPTGPPATLELPCSD